MRQILQNLSNGETKLEEVPCPKNIKSNIYIMLNFSSIEIEWKTVCDKTLNLDSVSNWENLILVSAKDKHSVLCFDKDSGKLLHTIGSKGFDHDKFNRPNGIKVIKDYLFIVERDNKRCHIINMRTKEALDTFGPVPFKVYDKFIPIEEMEVLEE